jgi:hypothetical protein
MAGFFKKAWKKIKKKFSPKSNKTTKKGLQPRKKSISPVEQYLFERRLHRVFRPSPRNPDDTGGILFQITGMPNF